MPEIQAQVEQFVKEHWKWDDDYKGTALYSDTLTLLRQVVEECCKEKCKFCENGDPVETDRMGSGVWVHYRIPPFGHGKLWSDTCESTEIRNHFAWLEGE